MTDTASVAPPTPAQAEQAAVDRTFANIEAKERRRKGRGPRPGSRWPDADTAPAARSGGAEFEDLATVRGFAQQVTTLGEGSDFVQIVKACGSLQDIVRDLGGDMNRQVREFVEAAIRVHQDGEALKEQAVQVAGLAQDMSGA